MVTGSEVESGSLEEGKEEKEEKRRVGGWGGGREEGERMKDGEEGGRVGRRERGERKGEKREGRKTKHHAICVILSRHVTTCMKINIYTLYV